VLGKREQPIQNFALFDGESLQGPVYCLYTPPPEVAMAVGGMNGMPVQPQDAVMGGAELNGVGSGLAQGMHMGGMNGAAGLQSFPGNGSGMLNGGVGVGAPQQQQQQQTEPQLIE
jgi:ubiquitin-like 1-activating enzyme E1 A